MLGFVVMCTALLLAPVNAAASSGYLLVFGDVPADHWAYGSMKLPYEIGILEGYPK